MDTKEAYKAENTKTNSHWLEWIVLITKSL